MIVYLARDIPAFVMYCVYGESRSALLLESTDSMKILTEQITHTVNVNDIIIISVYSYNNKIIITCTIN